MIADYDVDDVGSSSVDIIGGWASQQLIVVMKCTNNAATNALLFPPPHDPNQHKNVVSE